MTVTIKGGVIAALATTAQSTVTMRLIMCMIACLVGTSYGSFGTATCASNFRLVSFSDWGEDTSVTQNTGTNAAALKVLR